MAQYYYTGQTGGTRDPLKDSVLTSNVWGQDANVSDTNITNAIKSAQSWGWSPEQMVESWNTNNPNNPTSLDTLYQYGIDKGLEGFGVKSDPIYDPVTSGAPVAPTTPVQPPAPTFQSTLGDMYTKSFTDPMSYWNEYMNGQGNTIMETAARKMAKAGRTGMLPTLQTNAFQDYMSNYLPSVRKDLGSGLNYETGWNTNLNSRFGTQSDFVKSLFGINADLYKSQLNAYSQAKSDEIKTTLGALEADLKRYDIDETTIRSLYNTLGQNFQFMDSATQKALIRDLQTVLGVTAKEGETAASVSIDNIDNATLENWAMAHGYTKPTTTGGV